MSTRTLGALCALLTSPVAVQADGSARRSGETDASGGLPPGLQAEATLYADVVAAWRSGTRVGSGVAWLADLSAELDTGAAGLWKRGLFRASLAATTGEEPTALLGDLQGTSNIEAPEALWVHDLFYEHASESGAWSLLAGLHDLNSDFAAPDRADDTIHSSLSYAPDVSQTGVSTYPSTAPGLRVRFESASGFAAAAGVYDGVAGDPADPVGTAIILRGEEGAFWIGEAGVRTGVSPVDALRVSAGAWHLDRTLGVHDGGTTGGASGAYAIAEWTRSRPGGATFGVYVQAGRAEDAVFEIDGYLGAAAVWEPALGRLQSVIAGVARASASPRWRALDPTRGRSETAYELSAKFAVSRGVTLQPHVQVVQGAGLESAAPDALLLGVRVVTGPWSAPARRPAAASRSLP